VLVADEWELGHCVFVAFLDDGAFISTLHCLENPCAVYGYDFVPSEAQIQLSIRISDEDGVMRTTPQPKAQVICHFKNFDIR
jgi:hypothetical protein